MAVTTEQLRSVEDLLEVLLNLGLLHYWIFAGERHMYALRVEKAINE